MVADEVQSGLGRAGTTFACDHEGVVPDIYIMGKALGGGLYPVSAIAADTDVLGVITPGSHGSTFGGNPLAAAIGREVIAMLQTGEFQERARVLGVHLEEGLHRLVGDGVVASGCGGCGRASTSTRRCSAAGSCARACSSGASWRRTRTGPPFGWHLRWCRPRTTSTSCSEALRDTLVAARS